VTDEAVARVASEFSAPRPDDLFAAIGYGKVTARQVLTRLVGREALEPRDAASTRAVTRRPAPDAADDSKIRVRGVDDVMVFRAKCCNPIRGEKIVGYITRGKGVSVHAVTCPNVVNLLFDPERRIDVEWDAGTDVLPYTVRLKINVEDRRGILADITTSVADDNTNIREVEANADEDHLGSIRMTVEISDLRHLERVMKAIRNVPGVLAVERAAREAGVPSARR